MDQLLDRAIDALKQTGSLTSGLSEAARAKIVQSAWSEASERAVARRPLFLPMRWLAVGGVVPVALFVVASLVFLPLQRVPEVVQAGPTFSDAQKVGGAVIFTIADGREPHRVVRSTDPSMFNESASQNVTDGRFLDRVNNGPVVVFYRID